MPRLYRVDVLEGVVEVVHRALARLAPVPALLAQAEALAVREV